MIYVLVMNGNGVFTPNDKYIELNITVIVYAVSSVIEHVGCCTRVCGSADSM